MAMGRLNPVYFLENAAGHVMLLPEEIGQGPALARRIWTERYKDHGWDWREAGTLSDVDRLQQRLEAQMVAEEQKRANVMDASDARAHHRTASNLYQRMISADCGVIERDFIRAWLDLKADKRSQWQQRVQETIGYIWARENDQRTRVEDRMGE